MPSPKVMKCRRALLDLRKLTRGILKTSRVLDVRNCVSRSGSPIQQRMYIGRGSSARSADLKGVLKMGADRRTPLWKEIGQEVPMPYYRANRGASRGTENRT